MTEQLNQQLSAFVDNELPEKECSLFVRRLCKDDELKSTVNRFALIGDAMRGELLAADVHVSRRISEAIAREDAEAAAEQAAGNRAATAGTNWSRWLRPVSGLAVAATVAAVAVLSLQGVDAPDSAELPSSTVAELNNDDSGALSPVTLMPRPNIEVVQVSVMPPDRMDQLIMRHRGQTNVLGPQSVMSMRNVGTSSLVPIPAPERPATSAGSSVATEPAASEAVPE